MQQSIELMCEWCDLVCEEIEFYYHHKTKSKDSPSPEATFGISVRFEWASDTSPTLRLRMTVEDSWTPVYLIHAAPNDNAARYITASEVTQQIDSSSTFALALRRIEDCLHHERCPRPERAALPTRVIDCSDPTRPRIFISTGQELEFYVALSYVWGEKQPHSTTAARLTAYIQGIDWKYIPKTVRDAIAVTHALGLRYLWVDAYCIIQDSDDDKAVEISRIRSVFCHAHLTIIAATAHKVTDGFLHDRPAWYPPPSTLPFRCPDGAVGAMFMRGGQYAPAEPVNTRAWCLEERVLSPRKLLYCSHTLQYECQTTHVNVNGAPNFVDPFDGIPRLPDRIFTSPTEVQSLDDDSPEAREMRKAWDQVLGLYTRRALTKPRDRLLALSGVVEQFHRFWQGSRYLAGLWEHQFPGCLLWNMQKGTKHPRPGRYRAPTWSWASIDGEITATTTGNSGAICTVVKCEAVAARQVNPYGEVTSGVLVLNAIVRKAIWDPVEGDLFECDGGPAGVSDEFRSERGEIGYVTADALEEASRARGEVYLAVVTNPGQTLLGLVIIPEVNATGTSSNDASPLGNYRRVGWFTAPFCDKPSWLSEPHRLVQIV